MRLHDAPTGFGLIGTGNGSRENTHTSKLEDARDLLKVREGAVANGEAVSPEEANALGSSTPPPISRSTTPSIAGRPSPCVQAATAAPPVASVRVSFDVHSS